MWLICQTGETALVSCVFPTWWGCWFARCSRRRSDRSDRTRGIGASWRSGRRTRTTDSITVWYNNPLLWITGGGCISAWPGDQNINWGDSTGRVKTWKETEPRKMSGPKDKNVLNLLPGTPFCLAFPFGTVATTITGEWQKMYEKLN